MEFREHTKNKLYVSTLGLNTFEWMFFTGNINSQIEEILNFSLKKKINFISLQNFNSQILDIVLKWQKNKDISFYNSIGFGFPQIDIHSINELQNKNIIFENRFLEVENEAIELVKKYQLKKINFFSLFYPKLSHLKLNNFDLLSKNLKEAKIIDSFGIRCQNITDAILITKSLDVDHVEIEVDINTSPDLLNGIFKVSEKKDFSILCLQKEKYTNKHKNDKLLNDSIEMLIEDGEKQFTSNLIFNASNSSEILYSIALRKNLANNYQNIALPIKECLELENSISHLSKPYLTINEDLILQKSIESPTYESPKGNKIK
jgi:hypothetical protein